MPFNIQQFRSAMVLDGARPNLFECRMTFPDIAAAAARTGSDGLSISEQFSFFCRAAQLPGSTVNAIPMPYFGRELKFAGNRTFTEWTVTIINDEDFKIRNAIELWMNSLNSHRNNLRSNSFLSPSDYQRDAHVIQYGKTGEALKSYSFIGMFPIDVSPIELDWGANDTIEEYAVTFSYQWWESSVGDSNGTGLSPPSRNVNII
jgi:hypothetical protein